jgi:hypothetical protein
MLWIIIILSIFLISVTGLLVVLSIDYNNIVNTGKAQEKYIDELLNKITEIEHNNYHNNN